MAIERILIVFKDDMSIGGIASYAKDGVAEEMSAESAAALIPHAALLAQIQSLQATVAGGVEDKARTAELEARIAELTAPPVEASITRQQIALEMLARDMVSADEAIALAASGAAPAFIAALIEMLPAEQRPVAHIALTQSVWRRAHGLLATLTTLPGAPSIDLDAFFAAAAARN